MARRPGATAELQRLIDERAFLDECASYPDLAAELPARWSDWWEEYERVRLLDPAFSRGCVIEIRPGAGGRDAQEWAADLLAVYCRYWTRRGWDHEIVDCEETDDGVRGVTVRTSAPYGLMRGEHGVHRIAHHSRFGTAGKRQTSRASVQVWPTADAVDARVDDADVDVTTYAGSSKGGQHANRSSTNVRMRHRPTGMTASATGRSLQQNLQSARQVLNSRVVEHLLDAAEPARARVRAGFGGRIRSYVTTPYELLHDHRLDRKWRRLDGWRAGDLDEIVRALAWTLDEHRPPATDGDGSA